jgi:hypothetical protein
MLRPLAATAAATAAVVLLAACGAKDDKKSDAKSEGGGASSASTPSAPAVASFDPPKALLPVSAFGVQRSDKDNEYSLSAGMVGQTSLISGKSGITGRNIAAQGEPWTVPTTSVETTTTLGVSTPMPVQLDGKDVVAIAYVQTDKGNGTQKAKGLVLFRWIDATDGKVVAEVPVDLTPALGPGLGGDNVVSQAYDAATGQIAVGVGADGGAAAKKAGEIFTVYADPKTKKSSVIPKMAAAGVLNGVVAGAIGSNEEGAQDGTIAIADAAGGKITKQIPTRQNYLKPAGAGVKRAYFYGNSYVVPHKYDGRFQNVLYSVDLVSGAMVQTPMMDSQTGGSSFNCLGDEANAVVCTDGADGGKANEIVGFDDTTGKKAWGYNDKSASRIVPAVTAAFHGIIYAQTEAQPVLMDAATGNDVPTSGSTPSTSTTPGSTPSDGGTPTESSTPSQDPGSQSKDPGSANGSDFSLFNQKPQSPTAVTKYGAAYLQPSNDLDYQTVLIALKPTA